MKHTSPILRLLSRTSFGVALPAIAFLFGLVVASAFSAVFLFSAFSASQRDSDLMAKQVAGMMAPEIVTGDRQALYTEIESLNVSPVAVVDQSGELLAGDSAALTADGITRVEVEYLGDVVGTVFLPRLIEVHPPLPFWALAVLILGSALAAMVFVFATTRVVTAHIRDITTMVSTFQMDADFENTTKPLLFTEFRRLQTAALRTARRLKSDIDALRRSAYIDERTGLSNTLGLNDMLAKSLAKASFDAPAAYILLDMDGLDRVADEHGSSLAQEMMQVMAKRLARFISQAEDAKMLPRGSWPVFALPSSAFAVLVDRYGTRDDLSVLVRGLRSALRMPVEASGRSMSFTVSGGLVVMPEDAQTPSEVIARAETALKQARREEASGFRFYTPKLDRQAAAKSRLEAELREAVDKHEFEPMFQPKIDLATGMIVGAEALARWRLESGRIISPAVFIPIAEDTGLIRKIGEQIARRSCDVAAKWVRAGYRDISVAVNVSPRQFEVDGLGEMIIDALSESGLPPKLLELEITESVAVSNPDRVKEVVRPLRALGVKIAIDDFGTGHSNLSMLSRLAFDVFKIDRQFISNLTTDRQAPAIVEMILGMAETLGMQTVAEGIETEAQAEFLRRRGCMLGQGFLYSQPVPANKFVALLAENRKPTVARRA